MLLSDFLGLLSTHFQEESLLPTKILCTFFTFASQEQILVLELGFRGLCLSCASELNFGFQRHPVLNWFQQLATNCICHCLGK